MKKSEQKQKLVEELANLSARLGTELSINRLYAFPNQDDTQEWVADVKSVLKNLEESDYQEFVRLSKTVGLSEIREERKKAAKEINQFLKGKVKEWKRYDFSYLDKEDNVVPELKFGEPGKPGQPGGGGSVYIQAGQLSMGGTGRISADGGDYISQRDVTNSPIQTGGVSISISDITDSFYKIREQIPQNVDSSSQEKAKELLDNLENALKKDDKEPGKITKIFGQISKTSKWLAGQLIQGAVGGLIQAYVPPILLSKLT